MPSILEKEDPKVRERYGKDDGRMFLTARRLVEAGVRVVTFDWGGWDTHGDNFNHLRRQLPQAGPRHERPVQRSDTIAGLEKDVTVVMWGEFGRTPRVNPVRAAITGRAWPWDSWPAAACDSAR